MFSNLDTRVIQDGKKRLLLADYTYENDKYVITLKPGFITDGASIPRFAWSIISSPFFGPLVYGAMIHDGLYTKMYLPRKECDKLLRQMAKEKKFNRVKRFLVYYVVRLFGGSHWNKDTSAETHLVTIKVK